MKKLTTKEFIEKAKKIHGDKYDYSESEYINSNEKIKIKCNYCDSYFFQKASHHIYDKAGCPHCNKIRNTKGHSAKKLTTKEFIEKAKKIHGDKYDYSESEYINYNEKIKIKCNYCGSYFFQTPHNHLLGFRGCLKCGKKSIGEEKIRFFLKENNIFFEEQKRFLELGLLSYDFYLPNNNLLIEFNGKQHYEPVEYFGGEKQLKIQQEHDKIKRKFANDNKYNLLEISYKDDLLKKLKAIL